MLIAFAASVLERGPNPRHGNKTDNAHPPIHPTKYTDGLQVCILFSVQGPISQNSC